MMESRHDQGALWRRERRRTFHRVLKHRPVSDERAVLFRPVEAEPPEHEGLDSLSFPAGDRKSTRLNSSHVEISYAVFCLKKKTKYLAIPRLFPLPVHPP